MRYFFCLILGIGLLFLTLGCGEEETPNNPPETPMVLIPAGEFQMGNHFLAEMVAEGHEVGWDEQPVHTVYVDAFYMDVYEVTNSRYREFVDATGHREPEHWGDPDLTVFSASDHPVVAVTWHDAVAYAEWAGKRLPTEAEWEYAACGGLVGEKYPWGNEISHDHANYTGTGSRDVWEYLSPAGSFAPNGYGLYDMAGNVWEWCADWYEPIYYQVSPRENPTGPDSGSWSHERVVRGGSYFSRPSLLRVANRYHERPAYWTSMLGFRCVRSVLQN
ncbi:formylglycine-generating enzyme family protein [Candidatus Poribacteria bacterium]